MRSTPEKIPAFASSSSALSVGGGDGQFTDYRGVVLNQPVQVDIPDNQVAFGGRRHPALVGVDQLQGVAGELELLLKGVIGVAHGAHGDEGRLRLPGQVVPEQAQGVRLGLYPVEVRILVAGAAAVAVETAVAAAPVEVHGVVGSKPACGFAPVEQVLGGDVFHNYASGSPETIHFETLSHKSAPKQCIICTLITCWAAGASLRSSEARGSSSKNSCQPCSSGSSFSSSL